MYRALGEAKIKTSKETVCFKDGFNNPNSEQHMSVTCMLHRKNSSDMMNPVF